MFDSMVGGVIESFVGMLMALAVAIAVAQYRKMRYRGWIVRATDGTNELAVEELGIEEVMKLLEHPLTDESGVERPSRTVGARQLLQSVVTPFGRLSGHACDIATLDRRGRVVTLLLRAGAGFSPYKPPEDKKSS